MTHTCVHVLCFINQGNLVLGCEASGILAKQGPDTDVLRRRSGPFPPPRPEQHGAHEAQRGQRAAPRSTWCRCSSKQCEIEQQDQHAQQAPVRAVPHALLHLTVRIR